jgi:heme-degrading monooxygenase HmoA
MRPLAFAAAVALLPSPALAQPVQQLRIYEIFDGNKQAFHDRFRDHAQRVMARHGFRILAMWESRSEGKTEFVYLLDWKDEAAMKAAWARFMADPEWAEIKRVTGAQHGRMVGSIQDRTLRLTDYSPAVPAAPAAR